MLENLHLTIIVELLLIVFIECLICSLHSPKKKKKKKSQTIMGKGWRPKHLLLLVGLGCTMLRCRCD